MKSNVCRRSLVLRAPRVNVVSRFRSQPAALLANLFAAGTSWRKAVATLALVTLCLCLTAAPALALQIDDAFAGSRFDGNFYSVNLASGAATQIGPFNVLGLSSGEEFFGLEFGNDGNLYGLTTTRLLRIDPTSGTPTTIGVTGLSGSGGDLALDHDGTMFGVLDNDLFTVNLATGAATLRGSNSLTLMTGLVFAPNGTLYTSESDLGTDALYILDKTNGANLGVIGALGSIGSQGIDVASNGTVYMIDDFVNNLYTLDLSTAAKTLVGSTLTTRLQSLAIFAVPEPSTLTGLLVGVLALFSLGRLRHKRA